MLLLLNSVLMMRLLMSVGRFVVVQYLVPSVDGTLHGLLKLLLVVIIVRI